MGSFPGHELPAPGFGDPAERAVAQRGRGERGDGTGAGRRRRGDGMWRNRLTTTVKGCTAALPLFAGAGTYSAGRDYSGQCREETSMKLPIQFCPVCAKSGHREMQTVSVADDGIYVSKCIKGHLFAFAHQLLKFYLLFEVGAHTIADGYYRDAVVSFCSSLERFYELYFRAICLKHGMPLAEGQPLPPVKEQGIPQEEVKKAWGQLALSSERQFGAFVAAYIIENKTAPKPIQTTDLPFKVKNSKGKLKPKPFQNFRNDVVHNGYIPTRAQALAVGHSVLEFISTCNVDSGLLGKMEKLDADLQYEAL
jgi:hypothetical protein